MVKLLTVYCALESAVKLDSLNALEKCSKRTCADSAVHDVDLELRCTSERKKNTPGLLKVCEKEPALAGLPLLRAGTPFCKVRLAFTFCSSQAGRCVYRRYAMRVAVCITQEARCVHRHLSL